LALAHRFESLLRQGVVADYAALARLGHVSRARISQIVNLLFLAPDLQEQILFLPPTLRGHDPICLRQLLIVAQILDWRQQRLVWHSQRHLAKQISVFGSSNASNCGRERIAARPIGSD
jgi:hypothetical protein